MNISYDAADPRIVQGDRALYEAIRARSDPGERIEAFRIPVRSGIAWKVPAGHVCRISTPEGPQVGDLNIWNQHNPRERMWVARTRQLQSAHLQLYDRLWSTLPYLRPLTTVVDDSLSEYGVDENGGRVHDLLGSRCDPYVARLLKGIDFNYHCHSNLVRAIRPFGLTEFDVHDVLNVFQVTGLTAEERYFCNPSPARPGDHIDFFAEVDLLMALSACPGGDLSVPSWGPNAGDPLSTCKPLDVEVFCLDDRLLRGWEPPSPPAYGGGHAIRDVPWGEGSRDGAGYGLRRSQRR